MVSNTFTSSCMQSVFPYHWQTRLIGRSAECRVCWSEEQPWLLTPEGKRPWDRNAWGRDNALVLLLTPEQVVVCDVFFPEAAGKNLNTLLHHEISRFTPFQASDVIFAVGRRQVREQRLELTLAVVLRKRLEALLDRLAERGVAPDRVDALDADGRSLDVDLLPPERRQRRYSWPRLINASLMASCLLLAVFAAWLWLHDRESMLEEMTAEVQRLQREAHEITELRQRLADNDNATGYLAGLKHQTPSMLEALQDLTQCLPNDTWLERLDIKSQGEVIMTGQSGSVGGLIGQLGACPGISAPRFQGAIQPDDRSGKDRFSLLADIPVVTEPALEP
ncbi:hypothetical protein L861_14630 [Litchfieldella anticariensis FP35 = DSM 16096]|uniref:GspL cytoplasmic actin-ATPase-like domain-containing protein n=1 Tax=Litchfieldella anticariensis (strain DSM 16096 / CECT 5854 / CIP 108499 / LMG 22089 / FP35) TaxID=1121939 RepID=S2KD88_LITA3|nr:PilN domain-containing protein [Halomonas anticariensis]EPC00162.1 hypothetical protein L861_14630 [Halomonas anticariensis FP35 = DSM 16096]